MKALGIIFVIMTLIVLPHMIVELLMEYAPMLLLIGVPTLIIGLCIALYRLVKDEMSEL